jgi:hypothetical protein
MIDRGAEGCGKYSCAGWAALYGAYHVATMGFASVHDPVREAYDRGEVSGGEYTVKGIGGGLVVAGASAATGRVAAPLVAGATTTRGVIAAGAVDGVVSDALTQGIHISAGVQDEYDIGQTAQSALLGGVIGGASGVGGNYLDRKLNGGSDPKLIVENTSAPTNYVLNLDEGDDVVQESIEALVKNRKAQEINLSELSKVEKGDTLSVVAHGGPDVISSDLLMSGTEAGELLIENGFKGNKIELLSCNTGAGSCAQDIANSTNAEVTAPWFNMNVVEGIEGVPQTTDPITGKLHDPGQFVETFKPKNNEKAEKGFWDYFVESFTGGN